MSNLHKRGIICFKKSKVCLIYCTCQKMKYFDWMFVVQPKPHTEPLMEDRAKCKGKSVLFARSNTCRFSLTLPSLSLCGETVTDVTGMLEPTRQCKRGVCFIFRRGKGRRYIYVYIIVSEQCLGGGGWYFTNAVQFRCQNMPRKTKSGKRPGLIPKPNHVCPAAKRFDVGLGPKAIHHGLVRSDTAESERKTQV